ncbi:carboxypeptidase-like regulatory domain-containing protein [Tunturiibacter empetritectus]|uniref:carboxypeptidase-like regulatory domain-containing protein n=1 Tax=Tunturiibacter empetritectus TaxID=3069691 RepID=UPI003D9BB07A
MMKAAQKMKFLNRISWVVIAMVALFCTQTLLAQTVTGTITGVVTDPSGALVGGASVVAHNTDTGVDSTATTNSAGLYRVQFLPIGSYEVTIDAKGFDKETIPAFQLEVLQTVTFNVKLTIGASLDGGQRLGGCANSEHQ